MTVPYVRTGDFIGRVTAQDVARLREIAAYLDTPEVAATEDSWFLRAIAMHHEARLPEGSAQTVETTPTIDDLLAALETAQRDMLVLAGSIQEWRSALEFYATERNWRTASEGFAAQYDPTPSPVLADRGDRARAALLKITP